MRTIIEGLDACDLQSIPPNWPKTTHRGTGTLIGSASPLKAETELSGRPSLFRYAVGACCFLCRHPNSQHE